VSVVAYYDAFEYPPALEVPDEFRGVTSRVTLSVRNVGDRPADDVVLTATGHGIAKITREDDSVDVRTFTRRLELGRLRHGEALSISLWVDDALPARDAIQITHNTGTTTVSVPPRRPSQSHLPFDWSDGTPAIIGVSSVVLMMLMSIGFFLGYRGAKIHYQMASLLRRLEKPQELARVRAPVRSLEVRGGRDDP
jgi:hypothetical protein